MRRLLHWSVPHTSCPFGRSTFCSVPIQFPATRASNRPYKPLRADAPFTRSCSVTSKEQSSDQEHHKFLSHTVKVRGRAANTVPSILRRWCKHNTTRSRNKNEPETSHHSRDSTPATCGRACREHEAAGHFGKLATQERRSCASCGCRKCGQTTSLLRLTPSCSFPTAPQSSSRFPREGAALALNSESSAASWMEHNVSKRCFFFFSFFRLRCRSQVDNSSPLSVGLGRSAAARRCEGGACRSGQ